MHLGEQESNAFDALKERLTSAPILGYPKLDEGYILHTDASEYAVSTPSYHKNRVTSKEKGQEKS